MRSFVRSLTFCTAAFAALLSPVRATDVVALRLPANTTIDPEGERRLISVGPDGTVAALAHSIDVTAPQPLAVRWSPDGRRETFALPRPQLPDNSSNSVSPAVVVAGRNVVYVTLDEQFSGAYMGVIKTVDRWPAGARGHDELTRCRAGSNDDETVAGADATGQLAATFERTGVGSFTVHHETSNAAPYAFVIDANGCHPRGRAIMLGVRGAWSSGYRGYLGLGRRVRGLLRDGGLATLRQRRLTISPTRSSA